MDGDWITYDVLIRRLVRAFLAALAAGVPARELAAVEATSDAAGKFAAVGEGCSSTSSCDRFRADRVVRPVRAGAGVERPAGRVIRERGMGSGAASTSM